MSGRRGDKKSAIRGEMSTVDGGGARPESERRRLLREGMPAIAQSSLRKVILL
jgi:hypothetical protein